MGFRVRVLGQMQASLRSKVLGFMAFGEDYKLVQPECLIRLETCKPNQGPEKTPALKTLNLKPKP